MMVKVLLYAYATGSRSRGWKRTWRSGCWRRETFRNTGRCASFGVTWRQALFVEVVRRAGVGSGALGKLSIDAKVVEASKRKAMSYDRMQEEEQRLESERGAHRTDRGSGR